MISPDRPISLVSHDLPRSLDSSFSALPGHGKRIGLLLHTWSLQRWMFDSWVEQLLLRLIEQVRDLPGAPLISLYLFESPTDLRLIEQARSSPELP